MYWDYVELINICFQLGVTTLLDAYACSFSFDKCSFFLLLQPILVRLFYLTITNKDIATYMHPIYNKPHKNHAIARDNMTFVVFFVECQVARA